MVRDTVSVVVVDEIHNLLVDVPVIRARLLPDHGQKVEEDCAQEDACGEGERCVVTPVLPLEEEGGEAAHEANGEDGECLEHGGDQVPRRRTTVLMVEISRGRLIALLVAFSLVTPLGLLMGGALTGLLGGGISILTSLAAGTFLYVCLCELLPEVFHRRQDGPLKLGLLVAGVTLMWAVHAHGGI